MKKLALILTIIIFIAIPLGCGASTAFATTADIYTGVLDDLQQDETFDVNKYPEKTKDYSLDLFQIAESVDGELFLYVYQPSCSAVTASEVRISTTLGDDVAPKDYNLTLLNRAVALAKYKVEDFTVDTDSAERYYLIVQIERPFDKLIGDGDNMTDGGVKDSQWSNGQTVDTVAYNVSKLFTVTTTEDGKVNYAEEHEETITITTKYCGYVRDFDGWAYVVKDTDSHFIAFDTDKRIDQLIEAEMTYDAVFYSVKEDTFGFTLEGTYKETDTKVEGQTVVLNAENEVSTTKWGLFGKVHKWNEIQSAQEFLQYEKLSDEAKSQILGKKWVLRFAMTPVVKTPNGIVGQNGTIVYGWHVTNISVLRLKFITDGVTYNLGVVDNKQTEGNRPSSPTPESTLEEIVQSLKDIWDKIVNAFNWLVEHWWVIIVGLIVIGIAVAIIIGIVKYGAKVAFTLLGKILWFVIKLTILLPFTLLYYGIRGLIRSKQDG